MLSYVWSSKKNQIQWKAKESYRNLPESVCTAQKRRETNTQEILYVLQHHTLCSAVSTFTNQTLWFKRKTDRQTLHIFSLYHVALQCAHRTTTFTATPNHLLSLWMTTCQTACVTLHLRLSQQSWWAFKSSEIWQSKKRDCFMLKMKALCSF
jgi:hypothetical protein